MTEFLCSATSILRNSLDQLALTSSRFMSHSRSSSAHTNEQDEHQDSVAVATQPESSLVSSFLDNLNATVCIINCSILDDPPLEQVVPGLVDVLSVETSSTKKKVAALGQLYDLTDQHHIENRVALVQRSEWMLVDTLITALCTTEYRRSACLMLNNLSLPTENKYTLATHERLLPALLQLIQCNDKETHLCCLIMLNLSFDETLDFMSTPQFLDTMATLVSVYAPIAYSVNDRKSVESEALKYTLGVLINIAVGLTQAIRICMTAIPEHAIDLLHTTPNGLERWTPNSLEDCCLRLLIQMAQHDMCLPYLSKLNVDLVLYEELDGNGGIHHMRARTLKARLDEWRSIGAGCQESPLNLLS